MTACHSEQLSMNGQSFRSASLNFNGGQISSDGGLLLLEKVQRALNLFPRLVSCFQDFRDQNLIEHSLSELIAQRLLSICLGYQDLNDHDLLRHDSLLAFAVGKQDLQGQSRKNPKDLGIPLASSQTLGRLELNRSQSDSRKRVCGFQANFEDMQSLFLDLFFESYNEPPKSLVLDIDHTDVQLHGKQEQGFFHGYYNHDCYLPFFIFCGEQLLCAKLRPAGGDPMDGSLEEIKRVVNAIRKRWPTTKIIVRGDSGFSREKLMAYLEQNKSFYVLGLGKNKRLNSRIEKDLEAAEKDFKKTGEKQRHFTSFSYRTLKSWSRERRIVAKLEVSEKCKTSRFLLTNLEEKEGRKVYEEIYCARGEMENRIKETQLYLFGERLSGHEFYTNNLRLLFAGFAYVLLSRLRSMGLKGTEEENLRSDSIRLKLLKIGARLRVTVRKLWIELSEGYVYRELFIRVWKNLDKWLSPI